ncbi:hypothetical protein [Nocardioides sp.]|nr:hypothetical protein [Nocardioides sp.]
MVLAAGERLFGDTVETVTMRLLDVRGLGHNLAFASYAVTQ